MSGSVNLPVTSEKNILGLDNSTGTATFWVRPSLGNYAGLYLGTLLFQDYPLFISKITMSTSASTPLEIYGLAAPSALAAPSNSTILVKRKKLTGTESAPAFGYNELRGSMTPGQYNALFWGEDTWRFAPNTQFSLDLTNAPIIVLGDGTNLAAVGIVTPTVDVELYATFEIQQYVNL